MELYKNEDYAGAIELFKKSIELDPQGTYAKKSAKYLKKAEEKLAKQGAK